MEGKSKEQLSRWEELFFKKHFDMGCGKSAQQQIQLSKDKPFRERFQKIPLSDLENLREQLAELKKSGVIMKSRNPYASPIVVVQKKNWKSIDYRTLNRRTFPDQYTTLHIEHALQCLFRAKWFSMLDLKSWYFHIPMHDDQEKMPSLAVKVL